MMQRVLPSLLALLSVLLAAGLWMQRRDPEPGLREARALVRQLGRPQDLVVVLDGAQRSAQRRWGPEALATESAPGPEDLPHRGRVVAAVPGDGAMAHEAGRLRTMGRVLFEQTLAGWTVFVVQPWASEQVRFDLARLLPHARVRMQVGDDWVDCPWNGRVHQCAQAEWIHVGPSVQTLEGQPVPCIWTHPPHDGALEIVWDRLPPARTLSGWAGLSDYAASMRHAGRVTLQVHSGPSQRTVLLMRTRGRRTVQAPLSPDAPLRLTFEATQEGVHHACWHLRALGLPQSGGS
jgi:hypothetical protein